MVVLRESPWYEQILQEGRQEGQLEILLETLLETLEVCFGSVPGDLVNQLNTSTADQLRGLHRQALICSDLDTFRQLL